MLTDLFEIQNEIASTIDLRFKRYLYQQIDWNGRLLAITGGRGVGKTTLLIQFYKEHFSSPDDCLYISADNIKVASTGLFEIASEFFKMGGKYLIIDEVHRYPGWAGEVKNIYDSFPRGKVAISGSSTLDILKGKYDLSRRIVQYNLRCLSFREFLFLETDRAAKSRSLEEILSNHTSYASDICGGITILKHFRNYLKYGCYPFYLEGRESFLSKLNNVVEKVLSEDIPSVFGLKPTSIPLLRKLIFLVATSQPFMPNIDRISSQLKISKEYVYSYLEYIQKAGLFEFLLPLESGFKLARKPAKIYMENPNLFHAVLGEAGFKSEIGAVRESFFLNQLKCDHKVFSSGTGDFQVGETHTFEVGGKGKSFGQIGKAKNAFLAVDDVEIGHGNKIPLWMFGFLY